MGDLHYDNLTSEALVPGMQLVEVMMGVRGPIGATGATGEPYIAPPVDLVDAPTIAVNAALGSLMRVILAGNRTLGVPTNGVDAQVIMFEITQDNVGGRTISLPGYNFGTDLTFIQLSVTPGVTDRLLVQYVLARNEWDVIGIKRGF